MSRGRHEVSPRCHRGVKRCHRTVTRCHRAVALCHRCQTRTFSRARTHTRLPSARAPTPRGLLSLTCRVRIIKMGESYVIVNSQAGTADGTVGGGIESICTEAKARELGAAPAEAAAGELAAEVLTAD